MRHGDSIAHAHPVAVEQLQGIGAHYIGEQLLHAARDHQRRSTLAHDLVGYESAAQHSAPVAEQLVQILHAAAAPQLDAVAAPDYARALLGEKQLYHQLPRPVIQFSCHIASY